MAAITKHATYPHGQEWNFVLETISYTNLGDNTTVQKYIQKPTRAKYAKFVLKLDTIGGTSPTVDLVVYGIDPEDRDTTTQFALGGWNGITQITGNQGATSMTVVDIGPTITADDTGDATGSSEYGVLAILPEYLSYKLVFDGAQDDEDYAGSLWVEFA